MLPSKPVKIEDDVLHKDGKKVPKQEVKVTAVSLYQMQKEKERRRAQGQTNLSQEALRHYTAISVARAAKMEQEEEEEEEEAEE